MTPDELIHEIFKFQLEKDSDSDPGDITIDIQDDMPMVIVSQRKYNKLSVYPGLGNNIQEALENYLEYIKNKD